MLRQERKRGEQTVPTLPSILQITETKYCGQSTYNSRTHICCSDESLVEKHANCGLTVYNKCSQLCCGNRVYEKKGTYPGSYNEYERRCYGKRTRTFQITETKYCGRSIYNPRTHLCCSDENLVEKNANCGSAVYNKCSQLCCGNRVYEKKGTYPGSYNEYERRCYGQRTQTFRITETKYCGRSTYNPRTHLCCSDESLVEKNANCGSAVYNKCSQLCCGNRVYEKKGTYPGSYNEYERRCYGQRTQTFRITETKYCGRSTYNPRTHLCCSDESLVQKNANCGSAVYNKCSQLCCGNRVYEKKGTYPGSYNEYERRCYGQRTRTFQIIETKYCGQSTYNPKTQTCCSDKTIVEKDANCGSTVYNKCSQLCCGNRVYEKRITSPGNDNKYERRCYGQTVEIFQITETKYCGRSTYNPRTHICCSDKSIVEENANCGLTVYNKCSQLCCGNRVYEKSVIINGKISSYLKRQCHGSGARVLLLAG